MIELQEKSRENKPARDKLGRLLPGSTANLEGRPKGSGLNLTSLLKEKLEEIPEGSKESYKELFLKTLLHKALVEKDLQSLKLIINYTDGLPMQSLDLTSQGKALPLLGGESNVQDNSSDKEATETKEEN